MTWMAVAVGGAAAVGAGSSIFGSMMSSSGAKRSAEAIRYEADQARKTALELNDRSRKDLQPFRDLGAQTADTLGGVLSGQQNISDVYKASSLYDFQSELGTRALDRQLSARGMSGSGAGLESLALFDKSLVAEEGNRYFDKLFSTTQLGANAAAQQASNTTSTGNTLAQLGVQSGIAQGGAIANQYNAYAQGIQGVGQAVRGGVGDYMSMKYIDRMFPNKSGPNESGQSGFGDGLNRYTEAQQAESLGTFIGRPR